MSEYVKTVMARVLDNTKWECNRLHLMETLLDYPNITKQDLDYIVNKATSFSIEFCMKITRHPLVTFEWLLENNKVMLWGNVVFNPNVTTETVEKYPDEDWNWECMHFIKGLNIHFVLAHKNKDWHWVRLINKLSFEDYLALDVRNLGLSYRTQELCNIELSSSPNITIQNVIEHPNITWNATKLFYNPVIQKDLSLDLILSQIDQESRRGDLFVTLLKSFVLHQPINTVLIGKIKSLPESLNAKEWFFKSNEYLEYTFNNTPYFDPKMLSPKIFINIPMSKINEKVAMFYHKCEIETANVVFQHLNLGRESNCGIRQIIRQYL